ncbi:MAG: acyl-CoA thioesterase [Candidatus Binatia bacterium]
MPQAQQKISNLTTYRVIYGDTDQMGVVYYANFLRWFERGRTEFLRQIGLPYSIIEKAGYHFPVADVTCHYAKSAHYDDVVCIETELTEVRRVSLFFNYRITRQSDDHVLATGSTKHACLDRHGQVTRIPQMLETALSAPKASGAS